MNSKPKKPEKVNYSTKYRTKLTSDSNLMILNPKAAGIDIGAREIVVAAPINERQYDVWVFGTFTKDLKEIVNFLKKHDVDRVAMEATGNYWIPIYEMLVENGIVPILANPKNLKNVSGKKTDVLDAEWLATLLKYGLITGAFRPKETLELRGYIRQRSSLIEHRSPHILHINKALIEMNLRLSNVVSDIMGLTGLSIIRAIIRGERNPKELAKLRHEKCYNSEEVIEMSLEGHYKNDQLLALKQALAAYDFYQSLIDECDEEIKKAIESLESVPASDAVEAPQVIKNQKKKRNSSKNSYKFDAHSLGCEKTGVDLTRIDGLSEQNIWLILSEVGMDMSPWATEKHFSSWLGLCPHNMVSGGKTLKSRTKRSDQRARQSFMLAAFSLHSSKSALGAYFRRMRAKHGPQKATVATAHKLARLLYRMLKYGMEYVDQGQEQYEKQYRDRVVKGLQKKAAEFGFTLTPTSKAA